MIYRLLVSSLIFLCSLNLNALGLKPVDDFVVPEGAYRAEFVRDIGNITQIEFSGNLDYDDNSPGALYGARSVITQEFFDTHSNDYDYVIVYSEIEYQMPPDVAAFYMPVQNKIEGIGQSKFNILDKFAPGTNLSGYLDMNSISAWELDPGKPGYKWTLKTLAHEIMHTWVTGVRYLDSDGQVKTDMIGQKDSHWSSLLDSNNSVMYGHKWIESSPGKYTSLEMGLSYSALDLYLAGMYDSTEVPNMKLLQSDEIDPNEPHQYGKTISAIEKKISIEQIIGAEGERIPNSIKAKKSFNAALILLTADSKLPSAKTIAQLNNLRENFMNVFSQMTGGRGIINIYSEHTGKSMREEVDADYLANVDLELALGWLKNKQGVLGYWEDSSNTRIKDTEVANKLLSEIDENYKPLPAQQWMASLEGFKNTDDAARLFNFNKNALGYLVGSKRDRAWGLDGDSGTSVIDTALVAQKAKKLASKDVIDFLQSHQNKDGGWPLVLGGESHASTTAHVLKALSTQGAITTQISESAAMFLATKQTANGSFDVESLVSVTETALIIEALSLVNKLDKIDVNNAVKFLQQNQYPDGSWNESVYATAKVIDVLKMVQLPNLKVDRLSISEIELVQGETAVLEVEIVNNSALITNATELKLTVDGALVNTLQIPTLNPREGKRLQFDYEANAAGQYRLIVEVDPNNSLVEKTKLDNSSFIDVNVSAPSNSIDLAINKSKTKIEGLIETLPSSLMLRYSIKNLGGKDALSAKVELNSIDALGEYKLVNEKDVSLAGGSETDFEELIDISDNNIRRLSISVKTTGNHEDTRLTNNVYSIDVPYVGAPDYAILNNDVSVETQPIVNQDIEFKVKVRNIGTSSASPSTVNFNIKNNNEFIELGSFNISLNSSEFSEYALSWRPEETGLYSFNSQVDSENLVLEVNEANNNLAVDFEVSAEEGKNLSISYRDLTIQEPVLFEGANATVSLKVVNNSAESTEPTKLKYYVGASELDRTEIGEVSIPSLVSGETHNSVFNWTNISYSGKKLLYAEVDPANTIIETVESDNKAFIEIELISKPDLAIDDANLNISPTILLVGETATLNFKVLNLGGQVVEGYKASIIIDGSLHREISGWNLDSYSSKEFSIDILISEEAINQRLEVVLDPENDLSELNESNNQAQSYFSTSSSDFYVSDRYISPNGDGIKDEVGIYFDIEGQSNAELAIYDSSNEIVDSKIFDTASGSFVWSGKNALGYLVKDGQYQIKVKDPDTSKVLREAFIEVDTNRSSISDAIGTEFGELIDLQPAIDEVHAFFNNDQEIIFRSNGDILPEGIYQANYDGSDINALTTREGDNFRYFTGGYLITSNYDDGYRLKSYSFLDVKDQSLLRLKDLQSQILSEYGGYSVEAAYNSSKNNVRLLISHEGDLAILNIALDGTESVEIISVHEGGDYELSDVVSLTGSSLSYVSQAKFWESYDPNSDNRDKHYFINLETGEIKEINFKLLSYDLATKEIVHIENGEVLISDYYGNIKARHTVEGVNIDNALYDGLRKEIILMDNGREPFWGCGGFDNEKVTEEYVLDQVNGVVGGVYHYSLINSSLKKIASRNTAFIGECFRREGPSRHQYLPLNNDAFLEVEGYPYSLTNSDEGDAANKGLLKDGWFFDSSNYILKAGYIESQTGEQLEIDNKVFDQATKIVAHNLTSDQSSLSLIFNDQAIDGLEMTPSEQFLFLKTITESDDNYYGFGPAYKLFRSLMNLSVSLNAYVSSNASYIQVIATAADKNFDRYSLEYRKSGEQNWTPMITDRSEAVVAKKVHAWIPSEEGIYTIKLTATDKAGNVKESFTDVAWGQSKAITNLALDKEIFSPNGDGKKDDLNLTYRVNRPTNLEVRFYDSNSVLVREEFISHTEALANAKYTWDGRDQFGALVPDDIYTIAAVGLELITVVDNTAPTITDDCTPNLIGGTKDYFAFSHLLCFELGETNLDSISTYTKSSADDWNYYRDINKPVGNGRYEFTHIIEPGSFNLFDYKVDVIDRAGNKTSKLLNEDRKLGYFRIFGMANYEFSDSNPDGDIVKFIFKNKGPGERSENKSINLGYYQKALFLNTTGSDEVEFEISHDKETWESIFLDRYPFSNGTDNPIAGLSFIALKDITGLQNKYLRVKSKGDDNQQISNIVKLENEEAWSFEYELRENSESLIDIKISENTQQLLNSESSYLEVYISSSVDSRYSQAVNIYSSYYKGVDTFTSEAFSILPCTSYTLTTKVDGNEVHRSSIKSSCTELSLGTEPSLNAQCGELAEDIIIYSRVGVESGNGVNSITARLFVNQIDVGVVYSNLEPKTYYIDSKDVSKPKNTFSLDIREFNINDSLSVKFEVIANNGEKTSRSVAINLDNELPVFTNSAQQNGNRQCAINVAGDSYLQVRGQISDFSGNNVYQVGRSVFYGIGELDNFSILRNYQNDKALGVSSKNYSFGKIKHLCSKKDNPVINEDGSKLVALCDENLASSIAFSHNTKTQENVILQQGDLDLLAVNIPKINKVFHLFDQSGNHSCTNISALVDYEVEGLQSFVSEKLTKIGNVYYLSNNLTPAVNDLVTISAQENLSVKLTAHVMQLNEDEYSRSGESTLLFDGGYSSASLAIPYGDVHLSDNRYELELLVTDDCGITQSVITKLVVDSTAPTINLVSPVNNTSQFSLIDFFGSIEDENIQNYLLRFKLGNGQVWSELTSSVLSESIINDTLYAWDVSNLSGLAVVEVIATDIVGNEGLESLSFNIDNDIKLLSNFDISNRYISLHKNSSETVPVILQLKALANFEVKLHDEVIFQGQADAGLNQLNMPKGNLIGNEDGLAELGIEVSSPDNPGSKEVAGLSIVFDSTLPEIKEVNNEEKVLLPGQTELTWSDVNFVSGQLSVNNADGKLVYSKFYSNPSSGLLDIKVIYPEAPEGYYTVEFEAEDKAENIYSYSKKLLYDRTTPDMALLTKVDEYLNQKETNFNLTISVSDLHASTVNLYLDGVLISTEPIDKLTELSFTPKLSSQEDGEKVLLIEALDKAKNSTEISKKIIFDSISPNLQSSPEGQYIGQGDRLVFEYLEPNMDLVELIFDTGEAKKVFRKSEFSVAWPIALPDGKYQVSLVAKDFADNTDETEISITRDTIAPEASENLSSRELADGSFELYWLPSKSTDVAQYNLFRDGALINSDSSTSYVESELASGTYKYFVKPVDYAGNIGKESNTVSLIYDVTPPTVSIHNPLNDQKVYGVLPVTLSIPDSDLKQYQVRLEHDGNIQSIADGSLPLINQVVANIDTLSISGDAIIKVLAEDVSGNTSEQIVNISVDNALPVAPIISATLVDATVTLDISQQDQNASGFIIFRNEEKIEELNQSSLTSWSENLDADGIYNYYVIQKSESGMPSLPSNVSEVFLDLSAPRFTVVSPGTDQEVEKSIAIQLELHDDDISSLKVVLEDLQTGIPVVEKTISNIKTEFSLDISSINYGEYSLKIIATDLSANQSEKFIAVTLSDITPPPGIENLSWHVEGEKIKLEWEYDQAIISKESVVGFGLLLLDEDLDPIDGLQVESDKRTAEFSVEAGTYSVHAVVIDQADNVSQPPVIVTGIPVIIPKVLIPYTPTLNETTTIEVIADFNGDIWIEGDASVLATFEVNDGDRVKHQVSLKSGVNVYKIYGHYDDNKTIDFELELIKGSSPTIEGEAIYDEANDQITIQNGSLDTFHSYTVINEGVFLTNRVSAIQGNSTLFDGDTSNSSRYYDNTSVEQFDFNERRLISEIDVNLPNANYLIKDLIVYGWSGKHWVQLSNMGTLVRDSNSITLDQPYLSDKLKFEFSKASEYQYRAEISEISVYAIDDFKSTVFDVSNYDFVQEGAEVYVSDLDGFLSTNYLEISSISETLDPPILVAEVNDRNVHLSIESVDGVTLNRIYRNNVEIAQLDSSVMEFTDTDLANGTYRYYVVSNNDLGNRSAKSNSIDVEILQSTPDQISDLSAAIEQDSIILTWSPSVGSAGYRVYRRLTLSTQWELINEGIDASYDDIGIMKGTPYVYAVTAIDEFGNSSDKSNQVSAFVPSDEIQYPPVIISPQTNTTGLDQVLLTIDGSGSAFLDIQLNSASIELISVSEELTLIPSISKSSSVNYVGDLKWYLNNNYELRNIANDETLTRLSSRPKSMGWDDENIYIRSNYGAQKITQNTGVISDLQIGNNNRWIYSFVNAPEGGFIAFNTYSSGLKVYDVKNNKTHLIEYGYSNNFNSQFMEFSQSGKYLAYSFNQRLKVAMRQDDGSYSSVSLPGFDYDELVDFKWVDEDLYLYYKQTSELHLAKIDLISNDISVIKPKSENASFIGVNGSQILIQSEQQSERTITSYDFNLDQNWVTQNPYNGSNALLNGPEGMICELQYYLFNCSLLPGITAYSATLEPGLSNVFSAFGISKSSEYSDRSNQVNILAAEIPFVNASVNIDYTYAEESGVADVDFKVSMGSGELDDQWLNIRIENENGDVLSDEEKYIEFLLEGESYEFTESIFIEKDLEYKVTAELIGQDSDTTDNLAESKILILSQIDPGVEISYLDSVLTFEAYNYSDLPNPVLEVQLVSSSNTSTQVFQLDDQAKYKNSININSTEHSGEIDATVSIIVDGSIVKSKSIGINYQRPELLGANIVSPQIVTSDDLSITVELVSIESNGYISGSYTTSLKDISGNILETHVGSVSWLGQDEASSINQYFNLSAINNGQYIIEFVFNSISGATLSSIQKTFLKDEFVLELSTKDTEIYIPLGGVAEMSFQASGVLASYIDNIRIDFVDLNDNVLNTYLIDALPFSGVFRLPSGQTVETKNGIIQLTYDVNQNGITEKFVKDISDFSISFVDITPPSIEQASPVSGSFVNKNSNIELEVNDPESSAITASIFHNGKNLTFEESAGRVLIPTSLFDDGNYQVSIILKDEYGNKADDYVYAMTVDSITPLININSTASKLYSIESVTISSEVQEENIHSIHINLNDQSINTNSVTVTEDGLYNYIVEAIDKAGNEAIKQYSVYVDTTPPVINTIGLINGLITNESIPYEINFDELNIESTEILINGEPSSNKGELTDEGIYKIDISITDKANWSDELSIFLTIDKTPPSIPTLDQLSGTEFNEELVSLTGKSEPGTIIKLNVNGQPLESLTDADGNFRLDDMTLNIGDNAVSIKAVDKAGNESEVEEYSYSRIDSLQLQAGMTEIAKPTVLIFANSKSEDALTLDDLFENRGIESEVVMTASDFINQVRTMKFNVLMVSDVNGITGLLSKLSVSQSLELRSYIANGVSLVMLNKHPSILNLWKDVLGIQPITIPFKSNSMGIESQLFGNHAIDDEFMAYGLREVETAYGFGTLECISKHKICNKLGESPALIINQYGLGTTATFNFNAMHYVEELSELIVELVGYVVSQELTNYEYKLINASAQLLTGLTDEQVAEVLPRIAIEVSASNNALLNGNEVPLSVKGKLDIPVTIQRTNISESVEVTSNVYVDDGSQDVIQEIYFEPISWATLLASTEASSDDIEVPWFKVFSYIKFQYFISNIDNECLVDTCDVGNLRSQVYSAIGMWRLFFNSEIELLKHFGMQLMYLDYVERKQKEAAQ